MADTAFHDLHLGRDQVRVMTDGDAAGARRHDLARQVREACAAHLDRGRGYAIISGPTDLTLDEARAHTLNVSRAFGSIMPQDFQGEEIREIRDRGLDIATSRTARYSDTRFGGHLHTDGMHRPGHIPDLFILYCHRPARSGGDSVFVHVDDILDRLAGHPGTVEVLQDWYHFDTRDASGAGPRTVPRQIIELTAEGRRINYLREYVDSGHSSPGVPPLSDVQRAALDVVDAILVDAALARHVRLGQGDLMVINNRRLVHGRTDFVDHDEPDRTRLLLRTWIDTRRAAG